MKLFTVLASVITVAVFGTLPFNVESKNVASTAIVQKYANIFRKTHHADYWTLVATPTNDLSDPPIPVSRRQLAGGCVLRDTCQSKPFEECDLRACKDLTELRLDSSDLTGSAESLGKLTDLQYLCVESGIVGISCMCMC